MTEGYVVFDSVMRLYYQGETMISEKYDNVRLWTPWLISAKFWKTRKGAERHCPRWCGCEVVKVNIETMEVIE